MRSTRPIPHDRGLDATRALAAEGNLFILNRCRRYGTDVFETRLMLQPVICLSGAEAARLFYDEARFIRRGAAPAMAQQTLFGKGGVQGLDGAAHRQRKAMFMALTAPEERVARLAELTAADWERSLARWERRGRIVLFHEVERILCRAVCRWAGVPLAPGEDETRARDFSEMIDGVGGLGVRMFRGRTARNRAERWAGELIERTRRGQLHAPAGSALDAVARQPDATGRPLPVRVAAVELLNVLRPTVAVARFIIFAAHALHEHPECRDRIERGDDEYRAGFINEVRRFYPFFPFAAARVRKAFAWRGLRFPKGRRVLLDLYGTNHDERLWPEPERFRPERFIGREMRPFDLIPQGGSEPDGQHRCPGEAITVALMSVALEFLVERMRYVVPPQDLRVDPTRIPAIPESRFLIEQVAAERPLSVR